jgi:hypothetical protein
MVGIFHIVSGTAISADKIKRPFQIQSGTGANVLVSLLVSRIIPERTWTHTGYEDYFNETVQ